MNVVLAKYIYDIENIFFFSFCFDFDNIALLEHIYFSLFSQICERKNGLFWSDKRLFDACAFEMSKWLIDPRSQQMYPKHGR